MSVVLGMISQLGIILVALLLCLACQFCWVHRRILRAAWKLPSLNPMPALPCVGNGYYIVRGAHWSLNYIANTIKDALLSGSFDKAVFWAGPLPVFFVWDPEDAHVVLSSSKSLEPGPVARFMTILLGNGLVTAPVSVWKVTRRHVNALFHSRNLEYLPPVLNECGRDLVTSLTRHVGSGLVDVLPFVEPIALKSTTKLVCGSKAEVDMHSEKFSNILKALRFSEMVAERFIKVYLWPDFVFKIVNSKKIKEFELGLDTSINDTIEASRKIRLIQQPSSRQSSDFVSGSQDVDNASQLENGQIILEDTYKKIYEKMPHMTEKDLIYETRTLLAAGAESTKITVSSCLLALAAKPQIQEKLYSEIVSVTGPQDSDVTPEDIRAMPYLDQVLKETLRKFLIIPLVPRMVTEDLKLRDWTIPAGSIVVVCTFGPHHNPQLYPEPERFDPDRFSPENVAARGKNSFLAFGDGPRICIGKNYSFLALKILLAHVIKRFKFSTTADVDCREPLLFGVVSRPMLKDGYRVEIEDRKSRSSV